jgi:hypothetical protein
VSASAASSRRRKQILAAPIHSSKDLNSFRSQSATRSTSRKASLARSFRIFSRLRARLPGLGCGREPPGLAAGAAHIHAIARNIPDRAVSTASIPGGTRVLRSFAAALRLANSSGYICVCSFRLRLPPWLRRASPISTSRLMIVPGDEILTIRPAQTGMSIFLPFCGASRSLFRMQASLTTEPQNHSSECLDDSGVHHFSHPSSRSHATRIFSTSVDIGRTSAPAAFCMHDCRRNTCLRSFRWPLPSGVEPVHQNLFDER